MNEDQIICDKCDNFEVSMDNTYQVCHAKKEGSQLIRNMPDYYVEERFEGIKKTCKCFKKINEIKYEQTKRNTTAI